jgi:hypothetical protein
MDDKCLQELDYPWSIQIIAEHQHKDQTLMQHQTHHPEYFSRSVDGYNVIIFHNNIYISKTLRKPILSWYNMALQHSGIQQTESSIHSQLVWTGLSGDVEKHIKTVTNVKGVKIPVRNTDTYF